MVEQYSRFDLTKGLVRSGSAVSQHWIPHWSYLFSAVQVYTTAHCRFYIEQLGITPPKARLSAFEGYMTFVFVIVRPVTSYW